MTPLELQAGRLWVLKEFTRFSSMMRRLFYHLDHPFYHLAMNIGHKRTSSMDLDTFPDVADSLFPLTAAGRKSHGVLIPPIRVADIIPKRMLIRGEVR
jgi:hypothetical protein